MATSADILEPGGPLVPLLAGSRMLAGHTPLCYGAVDAAILTRLRSMRYECRMIPTRLAVDYLAAVIRLPQAVGRVLLRAHVQESRLRHHDRGWYGRTAGANVLCSVSLQMTPRNG